MISQRDSTQEERRIISRHFLVTAPAPAQLTRTQLLESLVEPGARIAPGYGAAGGPSAMPDMKLFFAPREVRDTVEFIASLE